MSAATMYEAEGERITVNRDAAVATIEVWSRKANSLSGAQLRALASTIREVAAEESVRSIVLESAGDGAFCAGASFDELTSLTSEEDATRFFTGFAEVILAMRSAARPIIVSAQGKAVGGGVGVLAAADYALATNTLSVRLSELELGIGPFVIAAAVERKVGPARFQEMALDCAWRDAEWSLRHGLVTELLPDKPELGRRAREVANAFAGRSPDAVAELKRVFWAGTDGWTSLLRERASISGRLLMEARARGAFPPRKR